MELFKRTDLTELLQSHPVPCVSIFMPAHRGGAEADPIQFRKHLTLARDRLVAAGFRSSQVKDWLQPGTDLLEDDRFWKNQADGLAFFCCPGLVRTFRLPLAFENLTVVGARFHIKPMLPLLESDGRFFVLALSQNDVRLFEGNRFGMAEVETSAMPHSLDEALVTHDRDEMLTFHSRPNPGGGRWGAIYHGHGVGIDTKKDEVLRFFQVVNRNLHAFLREERAPLVLATVDSLQAMYREANSYPHLIPAAIAGNPEHLSTKQLHDKAWPLVAPQFETKRREAADRIRQLRGSPMVRTGLDEVLPAAEKGEIQTLFVCANQNRWGIFDAVNGKAELQRESNFENVDLLDLAAAFTLMHGNNVFTAPIMEMPNGKDLAALMHLPNAKHGQKLVSV